MPPLLQYVLSLGFTRFDHHNNFQDGALERLVNLYKGRGCFVEVSEKVPDLRSDLPYI
jgi:hypothetical protein